MQLYTARYASKAAAEAVATGKLVPVAISNGAPRFPSAVKAVAKCEELCPPWELVKAAKAGTETKATFQGKYYKHLDRIGVVGIRQRLGGIMKALELPEDQALVLLCFEDLSKDDEWCHRRMFASWWLTKTGEAVGEWPEVAKPAKPQGSLFR